MISHRAEGVMFRMNGTSRRSTWMCDAKPPGDRICSSKGMLCKSDTSRSSATAPASLQSCARGIPFILNITRPSFSLTLVHLSETISLCLRTEPRVCGTLLQDRERHGCRARAYMDVFTASPGVRYRTTSAPPQVKGQLVY